MGIDYHTAKWLKSDLKVEGGGGKLLSLGRQHWWLTVRDSYRLELGFRPTYSRTNYADGFLRELGFDVESLDISPDEGAGIVHDMSKPVSGALHDRYDVILDLGTAEHVADQRQYWENVSAMLTPSGRVFGLSPIDGLCGHGLYQISPEFFQNMGGFTSELWITTYGPLVKTVPYTTLPGKPLRWRTYCRYVLRKTGPLSMPVQKSSMVTTSYKLPLDVARLLLAIPGIGIIRRTFF